MAWEQTDKASATPFERCTLKLSQDEASHVTQTNEWARGKGAAIATATATTTASMPAIPLYSRPTEAETESSRGGRAGGRAGAAGLKLKLSVGAVAAAAAVAARAIVHCLRVCW